jgi:hypothetical protein
MRINAISLGRARASAPRAARAIVGKWVPQWTSVGANPDRRPLRRGACSNEMRNTQFDNLRSRRSVGKAPNQEAALFLAASSFGLAMLSLLAVLALGDILDVAQILPFFALPLVLFIATAPLLRRWTKGEAERTATREAADLSSKRRPPKLKRTAPDGIAATPDEEAALASPIGKHKERGGSSAVFPQNESVQSPIRPGGDRARVES